MVKALIDGRKTQTRRVIKSVDSSKFELQQCHDNYAIFFGIPENNRNYTKSLKVFSKYNEGDVLWVKEPFTYGKINSDCRDSWFEKQPIYRTNKDVFYKADTYKYNNSFNSVIWHHADGMTEGMSRLKIRITNVELQRIQNITDEECIKEGVEPSLIADGYEPRSLFKQLWDSIYGASYSWGRNCYVWVYDFESAVK